MFVLLAVLIGMIAGMRSMTASAAVSWAARAGWLHLNESPLALLGHALTPYIVTALAVGEFVADKLPRTPDRRTAFPFIGRIGSGALSGAAIGLSNGAAIQGLAAGGLGAVAGTFGGFALRRGLMMAFGGKDLPAALIEDLIAVAGAAAIVAAVR
jgi:uncharacterized membrane protein